MNKSVYFLAFALIALLAWFNLYQYVPDSAHGLYRINRMTDTVAYDMGGEGWTTVKEEGDANRQIGFIPLDK